ncbi:hypothetical protein PJI16_04000 [Nitrospira sp. MA-1]|nr:hypothetical protein [Nitrospira sp. MA-1]
MESLLLLKKIFDRIELPLLESVSDTGRVARAGLDQWRILQTEIVVALVKKGTRFEFLSFVRRGKVKEGPAWYIRETTKVSAIQCREEATSPSS